MTPVRFWELIYGSGLHSHARVSRPCSQSVWLVPSSGRPVGACSCAMELILMGNVPFVLNFCVKVAFRCQCWTLIVCFDRYRSRKSAQQAKPDRQHANINSLYMDTQSPEGEKLCPGWRRCNLALTNDHRGLIVFGVPVGTVTLPQTRCGGLDVFLPSRMPAPRGCSCTGPTNYEFAMRAAPVVRRGVC